MIQIEFNSNYLKKRVWSSAKRRVWVLFWKSAAEALSPLLLNLSDSVWEGGGLQRVKVASSSLSDSSIETQTQCAPPAPHDFPGVSLSYRRSDKRAHQDGGNESCRWFWISCFFFYSLIPSCHFCRRVLSDLMWFCVAMCGWSRTSAVFNHRRGF